MLLHFTDANFRKEVLGADLPVVVDFWAPWCIDPSAVVLMDDRVSNSANRIKRDCHVLGYNGNKIKRYRVIDSRISATSGHCKRIVTDTGREIRVTDDHRFYTSRGWKQACELKMGDRLAIYPSVKFINRKYSKKILISERDIRRCAFENMLIDRYIVELKEKGLLPLKSDNPKLLILARLIGAQFSDGSLYCLERNNYREASFSVGQIADVEEIKQDLNNLGFECTYREKVSNCNIRSRSFVMHSYSVRCRSTSLWLLLEALGAPEGNKTNADYKIPQWLMNADDNLQREFLAAYLGGDGPTVDIRLRKREGKEPYNSLLINDIEFHKRTDLEKSGLLLGRQISELLSKFGVKVSKVFSEDDNYERKDKTKAKIIHIRISRNFLSGYNLCQRIGYSYARQKFLNTRFIGEFLRKRLFERQLCRQKYTEAISLFKNRKMRIKDIASELGLSPDTVFGWIKYNKKPTVFKHFEKYPIWLRGAKKGLEGGLLWEKLTSIESVYLDKVQSLIVEGAHNFIANGFLVHNCGPCKMIAPIIEELAKEYHTRVKIGKINIDENSRVATHFQVMSIPTIIFFKKGKVTSQVTGAISKSELKKKIEESLA